MSDITIYENLANAIILQAVKDYRMALKSLKANSRNRTAQADKAEIEQFFRSQWYSALTDVNGEMLIRSLQKEVGACRPSNICTRRGTWTPSSTAACVRLTTGGSYQAASLAAILTRTTIQTSRQKPLLSDALRKLMHSREM